MANANTNLPQSIQFATRQEETHEQINQLYLWLSAIPKLEAIVCFDGTVATPTKIFSQNVDSITKLAAGNYRITFASPFVGVKYGALASADGGVFLACQTLAYTAITVDVKVSTLAGALTDSARVFVLVIAVPADS